MDMGTAVKTRTQRSSSWPRGCQNSKQKRTSIVGFPDKFVLIKGQPPLIDVVLVGWSPWNQQFHYLYIHWLLGLDQSLLPLCSHCTAHSGHKEAIVLHVIKPRYLFLTCTILLPCNFDTIAWQLHAPKIWAWKTKK